MSAGTPNGPMRFQARVAVITGAAGGIGRAIALSLARRGAHLALADIDETGLAETAKLAEAAGVQTRRYRLDVADRAQVAALPAQVMAELQRVDLLVNNAGVAVGGAFEDVPEADFDWLMEINFGGLVRMTRAFLPLLRQSDDARIVNLSSLFGLIAPPGQTAYAASKFAVRGFSNALRFELAGSPIGITVAHPGGVATSIAKNARIPGQASPADVERERKEFNRMLRLPAEQAGEIIIRAVERRKARVIVGSDAKFMALVERLSPVGYFGILQRMMPKRTS